MERNMKDDEEEDFEDDGWASEENPLNAERLEAANPGALNPTPWHCAGCGEANETLIDLSAGYEQEYVEDCAVCCRPNLIMVKIDPSSLVISIRNELEYE
jgi:hypothetical protein